MDIKNCIIEDGFYIDPSTGEEVGIVTPEERFSVHDDRTFEWVMQKRFEASAKIANLEMQKKAINENIDKLIRAQERRIQSIDFRFSAELETYAAKELEGKKAKTLRCMYGSVAFRTIAPNYEIADEEKAAQWVEAYYPFSIEVKKKIYKSSLKIENVAEAPPGLFEIKPEHQKFTINTQIKEK